MKQLLLLLLCVSALWGDLVTREVLLLFDGGPDQGAVYRVYVRVTCDKYYGDGKVHYTVVNPFGFTVGQHEHDVGACPTVENLMKWVEETFRVLDNGRLVRNAGAKPIRTTPASDHLYAADNGRSAVAVFDRATGDLVTSIDVDDRHIGGLEVAADGRRVYAVLGPRTLGAPAPAYIAYIDPVTNAIVDRFELPGLVNPQEPTLAKDGRYLYFSARAAETGPFRIRVADLQAKTVAVLPDPVPANTDLRAVSLSPDGALLCAAGLSALSCYDTRTRTFMGRAAASPPNRELPPVFHPNGRWVYLLGRSFVNGVLTVYVSEINTATLTETARIPIVTPAADTFSDSLAVLTIDPTGSRLFLDEGFSGVLNIIDTRTHRVVKTVEGLTTGGLGGAVISQ